jgi:hypothetical protein
VQLSLYAFNKMFGWNVPLCYKHLS